MICVILLLLIMLCIPGVGVSLCPLWVFHGSSVSQSYIIGEV